MDLNNDHRHRLHSEMNMDKQLNEETGHEAILEAWKEALEEILRLKGIIQELTGEEVQP